MTSWIVAIGVPFVTCAAVIALLLRMPWIERLSDHPNERSLHTKPMPRLGGIAIVVSAFPLAMMLGSTAIDVIWMLAFGLALVSLADDLQSLPIAVRLAAHFAASAIAIVSLAPSAGWSLAALVSVTIALAWMTNLYNFMDGSDGLAGGMAVAGFGAYAIAGAQADAMSLALGSAALAASAAAFLAYNFPPARLFMGDAGSIPLGFLAGALGAAGVVQGAWAPWFPLLVFSPFIVDATVTIARRVSRGERFWIAHRSHYYQRLVMAGWSRRRLVAWAYATMGAAGACALAARIAEAPVQYAILTAWGVVYLAAIVAAERRIAPESAAS